MTASTYINFDVDETDPDGRILFLSNCPEEFKTNFAASAPVTLHKAEVSIGESQTKKFRLWFWHLNTSGSGNTIYIKFLVSNATSGQLVQISNVKYQFDYATWGSSEILDLGICLAVAQLKQDYQDNDGQQVTSVQNSLAAPLHVLTLPHNELVGGIVEFDAYGTTAADFRIRCVASRDSDFGDWSTAVWTTGSTGTTHIRGTWPQSNYQASSTTSKFDVLDTTPSPNPPGVSGPDDHKPYNILESGGAHYAK